MIVGLIDSSPKVLQPDVVWLGDGRAIQGHVCIIGDRISAVISGAYAGPLPVTRLEGMSLSPGLIDSMLLGAFGQSIVRGDINAILRRYARAGVTTCQLCSGNLTHEGYDELIANMRRAADRATDDQARLVGVYHEGPFMKREACGGNRADLCRAATRENVAAFLRQVSETATMINISPGIDRDVDAIRQVRDAGYIVTMCHSNAPAERAIACIQAGTTVLGHAWDNNQGLMSESSTQLPTIEQAALLCDELPFIHIISDGCHVHPLWMKLTLRCRGLKPICLVTDALPCAGGPDGQYIYDDGLRFSKVRGAGRDEQGRLFGGSLLLADQFRKFLVMTGIEPHQAVQTVTFNPARSLGLDSEVGLIEPGRVADLVAWDTSLRVRHVWLAGRQLDDIDDIGDVTVPLAASESR